MDKPSSFLFLSVIHTFVIIKDWLLLLFNQTQAHDPNQYPPRVNLDPYLKGLIFQKKFYTPIFTLDKLTSYFL